MIAHNCARSGNIVAPRAFRSTEWQSLPIVGIYFQSLLSYYLHRECEILGALMDGIKKFSQKIEDTQSHLQVIFGQLFKTKTVVKKKVSEEVGISVARLSALAQTDGAKGTKSRFTADEIATLLRYCVSIDFSNGDILKTSELEASLRAIEEIASEEDKLSNTIQTYFDIRKLGASLRVDEVTYKILRGNYFTYRWRPRTDHIVISCLRIFRDSSGLVVWENKHPTKDGHIPYEGLVFSQGQFALLVGRRNDYLFTNFVALRVPNPNQSGVNGLGLLENSNEPVAARVFFQKRSEGIEDLTSKCNPRARLAACLEKPYSLDAEHLISLIQSDATDIKRSITIIENE